MNRGFAPVILLLVVAGTLVIGGGAWMYGHRAAPAPEKTLSREPDPGPIAAHTSDEDVRPERPSETSNAPIVADPIPKTPAVTPVVPLAAPTPSSAPKGSAVPATFSLGDSKYTTSGPKKGYVYLCRANSNEMGGGAQAAGSWIHGTSWAPGEKISIQGSVSWPTAKSTVVVNDRIRRIETNDLPVNHTTGVYPVRSSDPAYAYDRNPNTILAQNLAFELPALPTAAATPSCIGGEVGVMTNGVVLFSAFDATLRDAVAREVQDGCDGHPQKDGEYHYHSLSRCFKNISVSDVIGFAFDGFPITGPKTTGGELLSADLDECHGMSGSVVLDGKKVNTYHYVMTRDFPYSVSCFRGKPTVTGPTAGTGATAPAATAPPPGGSGGGWPPPPPPDPDGDGHPPATAVTACTGKSYGASCSFFDTDIGVFLEGGSCETVPTGEFACIPPG